jgi:hypothetical protein
MKQLIIITFINLLYQLGVNGQSFSIDSSFIRSDSCVQIQWIPDTVNTNPQWYITNGNRCTGGDSVYLHCDFLAGQSYTGIAYSYGGEDPWYLFQTRLLQGYLAGSHLCHYYNGDPSNYVTGTDCSGFISYLWNYPRVSTVTFASSSDFKLVSYSEIKPGDAIVKSGSHIVFVLEADTITEVVISEASSTSRGCRERVVDLTNPEWALYKAIRYPGLNANLRVDKYSNKNDVFSVKNNVNGNCFIAFSKPFSGVINVASLDGKKLYNSAVYKQLSVPATVTGHSIVIIYAVSDQGKEASKKVSLLR